MLLSDDFEAAGTEVHVLGFALNLHAALTGILVSGNNFARNISVIVGAYDFPMALSGAVVAGFKLHRLMVIR